MDNESYAPAQDMECHRYGGQGSRRLGRAMMTNLTILGHPGFTWIDFERAEFVHPRAILGTLSPNRKRRLGRSHDGKCQYGKSSKAGSLAQTTPLFHHINKPILKPSQFRLATLSRRQNHVNDIQWCPSRHIPPPWQPLACLFILLPTLNFFLHPLTGQRNGFSPVWLRLWIFKLEGRENSLSHVGHV